MAIDLSGAVTIRVKNWATFQHYKERRPPWIKLHKTTLDDFKYHKLPLISRALAPLIWLLASEYDEGVITSEISEMAFRLRVTEKELREGLTPLVDAGFLIVVQSASNALAPCKQHATPETETETEEETKTEGTGALRFVLPDWIQKETWDAFEVMRHKIRKPMTDHARRLMVGKLERLKADGHDPELVLNESIANSWQGVFPLKDIPVVRKPVLVEHRCINCDRPYRPEESTAERNQELCCSKQCELAVAQLRERLPR